jgi:protein disulfide-isomerase
MKTTYRMLAACVAALLVASAARAAEWTEDYASAVATAKREHKLILLDFTGSDWCIWCQKTDAEVFSTREFKDFADRKLILVKLDYPQEHPQSDAIKAQNARMLDRFGITGYPTLIVMNSNEKVLLAQTGYKPGGPEAFIASIPQQGN